MRTKIFMLRTGRGQDQILNEMGRDRDKILGGMGCDQDINLSEWDGIGLDKIFILADGTCAV